MLSMTIILVWMSGFRTKLDTRYRHGHRTKLDIRRRLKGAGFCFRNGRVPYAIGHTSRRYYVSEHVNI